MGDVMTLVMREIGPDSAPKTNIDLESDVLVASWRVHRVFSNKNLKAAKKSPGVSRFNKFAHSVYRHQGTGVYHLVISTTAFSQTSVSNFCSFRSSNKDVK